MTGRRRSPSADPSFPSRPARPRALRGIPVAVTVTAGALLASGCGALPGSGGSRETVTVMTFAPEKTGSTNMPGMPAMAHAYARWVNDGGGIDGHQLRVITCNERNTSRGAAACARRAVAEGVDAVVGSYSQHGNAFMSPLEAAGIPFIGGFGASKEEFRSPLSYPVNGGQATLLAGHGVQLADVCREVALVRPDSYAGDQLAPLLNAGLAEAGNRTTDVLAPEDATEYGKAAAEARRTAGTGAGASSASGTGDAGTGGSDADGSGTGGSDADGSGTGGSDADGSGTGGSDAGGSDDGSRPGCVTAALGDRTETFFDSFRRLPEDDLGVRVSSVIGSVGQPLIDRTGGPDGPFEGAYITGWYPAPGDSRWGAMKRVIDEYAFADNRVDPADAGVQTTWIAYTVLRSVLEELDSDDVTPSAVARSLDDGTRVTTGGLTPELRWEFDDMFGAPDFPRIVNLRVTFQVVREGRLVAQRKDFVDVSDPLTESVTL
ncbi:ABC transporter substrate-binding protein [Streptomyces sp. NPDC000594]|uniref:ABC transporter substrate-binding protein n=1 Tax=Streptomyces sp. NPDC000594 TaxID=3154261 RepID=UPI003330081A